MQKAQMRILVVDDCGATRRIVRRYLEDFGYQRIEEAADGDNAWFKILEAKAPFELVISDWHMPRVTGLDLLRRIRTSKQTANLPVILVTAERKQEEVKKAIELGVNNYLVKPFKPETLLAYIHRIIAEIDEEQEEEDGDLAQRKLEDQRDNNSKAKSLSEDDPE